MVFNVWDYFKARYYFQEGFGYYCVDEGDVHGRVGGDASAYFLRVLRRDDMWPYDDIWKTSRWDWDSTYDMIEAVHDLVSKPVKGRYHSFSDCGWHYETFDRAAGQAEYRDEMNEVLRLCEPAYQLDAEGRLISVVPDEFRQLVGADVPEGTDEDSITSKMEHARHLFLARASSRADRRNAVRELADVIEALKPEIKKSMMSADEDALFHIANKFALRHNDRIQRTDYDRDVWLRWMFYVYLATIHALLRVRERP